MALTVTLPPEGVALRSWEALGFTLLHNTRWKHDCYPKFSGKK